MGSEHNRTRRKWQGLGGTNANTAERAFFDCFSKAFVGTNYDIIEKPKEFRSIYVDFPLDTKTLSEIYTPDTHIALHGILPDYAITNRVTGKTIYIEVKRQDGWVEGKPRSAGRGNAHERSCKFFTPGLLKILREHGKINSPNLPFWTVFQGDITRDPCRVREITSWYGEYTANYFFWRHSPDPDMLFAHFDEYIAPLLEGEENV